MDKFDKLYACSSLIYDLYQQDINKKEVMVVIKILSNLEFMLLVDYISEGDFSFLSDGDYFSIVNIYNHLSKEELVNLRIDNNINRYFTVDNYNYSCMAYLMAIFNGSECDEIFEEQIENMYYECLNNYFNINAAYKLYNDNKMKDFKRLMYISPGFEEIWIKNDFKMIHCPDSLFERFMDEETYDMFTTDIVSFVASNISTYFVEGLDIADKKTNSIYNSEFLNVLGLFSYCLTDNLLDEIYDTFESDYNNQYISEDEYHNIVNFLDGIKNNKLELQVNK